MARVMASSIPPPLIFIFASQGPQHISMGKRLFHAYHTFRRTVLEMDAIYKSLVGVPLVESTSLFRESPTKIPEGILTVEITLPVLTIVQIALYGVLVSVEANRRALIGHSADETASIYASGVGSKTMALDISISRIRSMKFVEDAANRWHGRPWLWPQRHDLSHPAGENQEE